jgi:hypothetical protein
LTKHALLIGNCTYADPRLPPLGSTLNDVKALEEILLDPEICAFDSAKRLVDPTAATAKEAIYDLFDQKQQDDLLLLYFSGHGVIDAEGRFFFALCDSKTNRLPVTAVSAAETREYMDSSRSRRQLVILDCCHAGAFPRGAKAEVGGRALTRETFSVKGYGREILTATDETSFAFEGDAALAGSGTGGLGIFTAAIVEGVKTGAAAPDKDELSVLDVFTYARGVTEAQDRRMKPRHWCDDAASPIILARNPNPVNLKELLAALGREDRLQRLGAVYELSQKIKTGPPGLKRSALKALEDRLKVERDVDVHKALGEAIGIGEPLLPPPPPPLPPLPPPLSPKPPSPHADGLQSFYPKTLLGYLVWGFVFLIIAAILNSIN